MRYQLNHDELLRARLSDIRGLNEVRAWEALCAVLEEIEESMRSGFSSAEREVVRLHHAVTAHTEAIGGDVGN